mgnify:CR=1 FL=1
MRLREHHHEGLIRLMEPKYIEVWGKFTPRGGISIDPTAIMAVPAPAGRK